MRYFLTASPLLAPSWVSTDGRPTLEWQGSTPTSISTLKASTSLMHTTKLFVIFVVWCWCRTAGHLAGGASSSFLRLETPLSRCGWTERVALRRIALSGACSAFARESAPTAPTPPPLRRFAQNNPSPLRVAWARWVANSPTVLCLMGLVGPMCMFDKFHVTFNLKSKHRSISSQNIDLFPD